MPLEFRGWVLEGRGRRWLCFIDCLEGGGKGILQLKLKETWTGGWGLLVSLYQPACGTWPFRRCFGPSDGFFFIVFILVLTVLVSYLQCWGRCVHGHVDPYSRYLHVTSWFSQSQPVCSSLQRGPLSIASSDCSNLSQVYFLFFSETEQFSHMRTNRVTQHLRYWAPIWAPVTHSKMRTLESCIESCLQPKNCR